MIDEEDVKIIVKGVRESKISKVWKDPRKAQNWGEAGWIFAMMFGLLLMLVIVLLYEGYFFDGAQVEFKNMVLNNLSCDGLRNVWFELSNSDENFNNELSDDIQAQIIMRCLK